MAASIPCAFLVVAVEGESILCFLLINFIVDMEIDMLVSEVTSGISVTAKNHLNSSTFKVCFLVEHSSIVTDVTSWSTSLILLGCGSLRTLHVVHLILSLFLVTVVQLRGTKY